MLNGWSATAGAGVTRDDYAALTMDQLKTAVKPFYDRLAVLYARVPGSYPWSAVGSSAEDYALANLGQLKTAFSFDIAIPDTNLNGFPDLREIQMFGNLNQSAGADPDLL